MDYNDDQIIYEDVIACVIEKFSTPLIVFIFFPKLDHGHVKNK